MRKYRLVSLEAWSVFDTSNNGEYLQAASPLKYGDNGALQSRKNHLVASMVHRCDVGGTVEPASTVEHRAGQR